MWKNELIGQEIKEVLTAYNTQLALSINQPLDYNNWYKLRISSNSSVYLNQKLFYHSWKEESIVRLFNYVNSDKPISNIPIDSVHLHADFFWKIDDQFNTTNPYEPPIPYTPSPPFIFRFLNNFAYFLPIPSVIIIAFTLFIVLKYSSKKEKERLTKQKNIDQSIPSAKYVKQEARYDPQTVYRIQIPVDDENKFELKTEQSNNITCVICYQNITDNNQILRCPSCDVAFHKNHLLQWVFENQKCPICKAKLRYSAKV